MPAFHARRAALRTLSLALAIAALSLTSACATKRPRLPQIDSEQRTILINTELEGATELALMTDGLVRQKISKLYFLDPLVEPRVRPTTEDKLTAKPFFQLASEGIDDLISITGSVALSGENKVILSGQLELWNVMLGKRVFVEPLQIIAPNDGTAYPEELQWEINRIMATRWNQPGTFPRVNMRRAADALFESGEFVYAQLLYIKAFEKHQSNTVFDRNLRADLVGRIRDCDTEIRKRGIEQAAIGETYKETLTFSNVKPEYEALIAKAFAESPLSGELRKLTFNPVEIYVQNRSAEIPGRMPTFPGMSIHILVNFSESYYKRTSGEEFRSLMGYRSLTLNPYAQTMAATLAMRERILAAATVDDLEKWKDVTFFLHLTRLTGDQVVIPVKPATQPTRPLAPKELILWLREYEGVTLMTSDAEGTSRAGYFFVPAEVESCSTLQKYLLEFFGVITITDQGRADF